MAKKKSFKKSSSTNGKTSLFAAVVMGTSAGGLSALKEITKQIDKNFELPIIIVQHLFPESDDFIAKALDACCKLNVKEADEKEKITKGNIYIAPANYHLMIEEDYTLSLTIDPKINYSRPSIDVLFDSAASVYKDKLIGVLLTGANSDGALGLKHIKELGGLTIAQDPRSAEVAAMPQSAIDLFPVDFVLPLPKISSKLTSLAKSIL